MNIEYRIGDARHFEEHHQFHILAHLCNDEGRWGSGFTGAISKKWRRPEQEYRAWKHQGSTLFLGNPTPFELGRVQIVSVEWFPGAVPCVEVANMIGQHGINRPGQRKICRVDYDALASCLDNLCAYISNRGGGTTVRMPRIGSGLACAPEDRVKVWSTIEALIINHLTNRGVPTVIYQLCQTRETSGSPTS